MVGCIDAKDGLFFCFSQKECAITRKRYESKKENKKGGAEELMGW